jgi:hypothetical protein
MADEPGDEVAIRALVALTSAEQRMGRQPLPLFCVARPLDYENKVGREALTSPAQSTNEPRGVSGHEDVDPRVQEHERERAEFPGCGRPEVQQRRADCCCAPRATQARRTLEPPRFVALRLDWPGGAVGEVRTTCNDAMWWGRRRVPDILHECHECHGCHEELESVQTTIRGTEPQRLLKLSRRQRAVDGIL